MTSPRSLAREVEQLREGVARLGCAQWAGWGGWGRCGAGRGGCGQTRSRACRGVPVKTEEDTRTCAPASCSNKVSSGGTV